MKKFTETEKYKCEWFADLPPRLKLLWYYLQDNSDHAGIWKRNVRRLNFEIGEDKKPYTEADLKALEPILVKVSADLYYFPEHLAEQHPNGLGNSRPHLFIKRLIEKQGFTYLEHKNQIAYAENEDSLCIGYQEAPDRTKDKDKDRDKEKDKDKDKAQKPEKKQASGPFHEMIREYESFIKNRTSVPAKFDGAEFSALKEIENYLSGIESVKNGRKSVPELWAFILLNFDQVEPFLRKGSKIRQINSNLIQILDQIKNGHQANSKQQSTSDISKAAELIRKGMEGATCSTND